MTLPDVDIASVQDDVRAALRRNAWDTPAEIWQRCGRRWSPKAVRQCLRDMHESSQCEGRIGGAACRQVREYRAVR